MAQKTKTVSVVFTEKMYQEIEDVKNKLIEQMGTLSRSQVIRILVKRGLDQEKQN